MLTIHDSMTSTKTGVALALAALLFTFACGGDDSSPGSGGAGSGNGGMPSGGGPTGGSSGSGGRTENPGGAGSGGTSGGTTGGTGGMTGGSGGAGPLTPFTCAGDVPKAEAITNFDDVMADGMWGDSTTGLTGGTFRYGSIASYDIMDGALHVAGNVSGYSGVGLYINTCTDASKYEGIQFTVSGDPGGAEMTFQLQTNSDYPISPTDMKGACTHDPDPAAMDDFSVCGSPQAVFMAPGTVTISFAELMGGKPISAADPTEILGMQWQFAWSDTATPYDVDITIDDVQFVETIP